MEKIKDLDKQQQSSIKAKNTFMGLNIADAFNMLKFLYNEMQYDLNKIQDKNDETSKAIISLYNDSYAIVDKALLEENLSAGLKEKCYDDYVKAKEGIQQYLLDKNQQEIKKEEDIRKVKYFIIKTATVSVAFSICASVVEKVAIGIIKAAKK